MPRHYHSFTDLPKSLPLFPLTGAVLLPRGALLTATAVPADVAATVAHVVERVVAGRGAELPSMTPLSAAELAVNVPIARTLGLPPVAAQRWVAREPD